MNYENYPYDIFNPMYLKNTYVQQLENWRNVEQQKNICDMVKAISDYCEAARKVAPDYTMIYKRCFWQSIKIQQRMIF